MAVFALVIAALALIPRSEAVKVGAEGSGTNEPTPEVRPTEATEAPPVGVMRMVPSRNAIGNTKPIEELTDIAHASPRESRWEIGSDETGAALGWTSSVFVGAPGPTPIFSYKTGEFVGFSLPNLPGVVTFEEYTDPGFDLESLAVERWGREKYDALIAHVTERQEQERKVLDGLVNQE